MECLPKVVKKGGFIPVPGCGCGNLDDVLVGFLSIQDTSYRHLGRGNSMAKNTSMMLACRQAYGVFSWLKIDVGRPSPLQVVSALARQP